MFMRKAENCTSVNCISMMEYMYMCLYVCVYVCVYICMYICIHMYINLCVCTCVCMYAYVYIYMPVNSVGIIVICKEAAKCNSIVVNYDCKL